MKRRRRDPVEVGTAIPGVLSELGLESAAGVVRIASAWTEAVGPEVAAHARPSVLRGRQLEVEVDSSVWCQQLQLRRDELLAGLRRVIGEDAPADLRFRLS